MVPLNDIVDRLTDMMRQRDVAIKERDEARSIAAEMWTGAGVPTRHYETIKAWDCWPGKGGA